MLSIREDVLQRAIDRIAARDLATAATTATPAPATAAATATAATAATTAPPWLGRHLGLRFHGADTLFWILRSQSDAEARHALARMSWLNPADPQ